VCLEKELVFKKNQLSQQFVKKQPTQEKKEIKIPQLRENEQKLENVYKKIPSFEHKAFLEGAKKAFEIIITAFNKGDTPTLKNLVSKDVYKAFEGAINDGSNNPNSQFYSLVIDGINDAKVENGKIIIGVNFISEQILSDNEEDIVKNKDTWVFEKPENSNGPAWTLVST
jgi:predicted lipid-binding transport protein (Tim44 family)